MLARVTPRRKIRRQDPKRQSHPSLPITADIRGQESTSVLWQPQCLGATTKYLEAIDFILCCAISHTKIMNNNIQKNSTEVHLRDEAGFVTRASATIALTPAGPLR
jgi:hypothetical protein